MTASKWAHFAIPFLALFASSCVFSIGGSGSSDDGMSDYSSGYLESNEPRQPDHFPGPGLPIMVAPWEGVSSGALEVTGVGYSSFDDGPNEAAARNQALDDAIARAKIMAGDRSVTLIEKQSYSATSDTDLGVKVLYGIIM